MDRYHGRTCLPAELQSLIIECLTNDVDRQTLKACRLVSRSVNEAANAIVYRVIHISASEPSLRRLENISNTPYLARHVHHLKFHRSTWDDDPVEAYQIRSLERSLAFPPRDGNAEWLSFLREQFQYRQGFFDRPPGINHTETTFIRSALSELRFMKVAGKWSRSLQSMSRRHAFPRLKGITVDGISDKDVPDDIDMDNRIFGSVHEQIRHFYSRFHLWWIFEAAKYFEVKQLDLPEMLVSSAFMKMALRKPKTLSTCLSGVQELNLGLDRGKEAPDGFDIHSVNHLRGCMKTIWTSCADSLQSLTFNYGSHNYLQNWRQTKTEQLTMTRLLMRQHFPRLQALDLVGCVIDEETMTRFLTTHGPTLRSLAIKEWTMPNASRPPPIPTMPPTITSPLPQHPDDNTAVNGHNSFIRLLWKTPQICNLTTFHLPGVMTNINTTTGIESDWMWMTRPYLESLCAENNLTFPRLQTLLRDQRNSSKKNEKEKNLHDALESYVLHHNHTETSPFPFPFSDEVVNMLQDDRDGIEPLPPAFDTHPLVTHRQDASLIYSDNSDADEFVAGPFAFPFFD